MKTSNSNGILEIPIIMTFNFSIDYLTKACDFVSTLYSLYGEVDFSIKSNFEYMEIKCDFKTLYALRTSLKELTLLGETK